MDVVSRRPGGVEENIVVYSPGFVTTCLSTEGI